MTNVAAVLWQHLEHPHWEPVAELAHPGVGVVIDAVRRGDDTTASLPVDVAVRLLGTLDDPRSAAAGDTRGAVVAAVGDTPARRQRRSDGNAAADALFAGSGNDILARITARRRIADTDTVVERYLGLDDPTRDLIAAELIMRAGTTVGAAVFADRATARRAQITAMRAKMIAVAGNMNAWTAARRISRPLERVLASAGLVALHPYDKDLEVVERGRFDHASLVDLVGAAFTASVAVRGPRDVVTEALGEVTPPRRGTRNRLQVNAVLISAATSGADVTAARAWLDVFDDTLPLMHGAVNLLGEGVGGDYIATILNTHHRKVNCGTVNKTTAARVLEHCGTHLEPAAAITVALSARQRRAYSMTPAVLARLLAGHFGPIDAWPVIESALSGNGDIRLHNAMVQIIEDGPSALLDSGLSATDSCCDGLAPLWDLIAGGATVADLVDTARHSAGAGAGAALARALGAALGDTADDDAWAAICALADTFDGTPAQLVDIAVATTATAA
jgi:hypothetical protein